jgi:hypothetical protein
MSYRDGILYSEGNFLLEYINKALFDIGKAEAESLEEMKYEWNVYKYTETRVSTLFYILWPLLYFSLPCIVISRLSTNVFGLNTFTLLLDNCAFF